MQQVITYIAIRHFTQPPTSHTLSSRVGKSLRPPPHRSVRFGDGRLEELLALLAAAAAAALLLLQVLLPARQPRVDRHEVGARTPRDEARLHV